jgi:hypothetical protein
LTAAGACAKDHMHMWSSKRFTRVSSVVIPGLAALVVGGCTINSGEKAAAEDAAKIFRQRQIEPWVTRVPAVAKEAEGASSEEISSFAQDAACAIASAVKDTVGSVDLGRIQAFVDAQAPSSATETQRGTFVDAIDDVRSQIEFAGLDATQLAELVDNLCSFVDAAGQL